MLLLWKTGELDRREEQRSGKEIAMARHYQKESTDPDTFTGRRRGRDPGTKRKEKKISRRKTESNAAW